MAPPGPTLVLAGPGSGKTRVLTHRIAYLVEEMGVKPWQIMAVTFTNKAAREMLDRVERLIGEMPRGLTMGTFHSTCARILRRETENLLGYENNFVIFDTDDQKQVIKQALNDLNLDDKRFPPAKMLSGISSAKNELITADIYAATNYIAEVTRRVYTRYQELLVANNAMDFDDLLLNTVLLFDERADILARYQERYQFLLVDEFQDTNTVQYSLLTRLAAGHRNLFAVGDSDQSIYKWRGADFRNINRFRDTYPEAELILLEQNYRSTQIILDAAKAVIRRNSERVDKDLFTDRSGGARIEINEAYNETEEAHTIVATIQRMMTAGHNAGDFAVMYRTNAQSRAIEEAFLRESMAYKLVGATRFYNRREIKDLIAYLRLVHNPADSVSFQRVINTPTRGIGKKTQDQLRIWGASVGLQPGLATIKLAIDPEVQHPFNSRAIKAIKPFGTLLASWTALKDKVTVGELLATIIDGTGFRDYLQDGTDEGEERWLNVMELRNVAGVDKEISLTQFLEQVSLVADVDNLEATQDAPTLLTMHAAKGLEFPVVFITGLEEGVLPHSRALDDAEELAEERRLFYVGLTRAMDRLFISHAFRRMSYGQSDMSTPSRFLGDIPDELTTGNKAAARREQTKSRMSRWSWNSEYSGKGYAYEDDEDYVDYDDDDDDGWGSQRRSQRSGRSRGAWSTSPPAGNSAGSGRGRATTSRRLPSRENPISPGARNRARNSRASGRRTTGSGYYQPTTRRADNIPEPPSHPSQPELPSYQTGQKVNHSKFGDGIIIETKDTGSDIEVTVAFGSVGIKRLAASFAKLEITDEAPE